MTAMTQRQKSGNGQDKLQTALRTLEEGVEQIIDGEAFRRYLTMMARLHAYSASNVLLIMTQRPDATMVAGYRSWQRLGRQVRKGERGLMVLAPITRKVGDEDAGEATPLVCGFRATYVFDVSQTVGDDLPEPPHAKLIESGTDTGQWLWDRLSGWLNSQGVSVEFGDLNGPRGVLYRVTFRIMIECRLMGTDHATKTLAHECAHFVAQHTGGTSREDAEALAESVAYVVLDHFGIDASSYSFPYVSGWAMDVAVLRRNLAAIQKVSHRIIEALETGHPCMQDLSEAPEMPVEAL